MHDAIGMGLRFDKIIMPAVERIALSSKQKLSASGHASFGSDPEGFMSWLDISAVDSVAPELRSARRFDCSRLDESFLADTGYEEQQELIAIGKQERLPFENCLFDFQTCAIWARELGEGDAKEFGGHPLMFVVFPFPLDREGLLYDIKTDGEIWHKQEWANRIDDKSYCPVYIDPCWQVSDERANFIRNKSALLLGLLALLQEKLLLQTKNPGLSLVKNARRKQQNKVPVYPYRVLTLNLAETRRRTKSVALHHHESPMLHWRRGHWRTLHRGSEFESRSWIRRCLVGDPDKGFAAKHYRPIWQSTVH